MIIARSSKQFGFENQREKKVALLKSLGNIFQIKGPLYRKGKIKDGNVGRLMKYSPRETETTSIQGTDALQQMSWLNLSENTVFENTDGEIIPRKIRERFLSLSEGRKR